MPALTRSQERDIQQYRAELIERHFREYLEALSQQLKQAKSSTPTCFISYAWHPKPENPNNDKAAAARFHPFDERVHQVAKYLWLAGIRVSLDLEQNHVGTSIGEFVQLIDSVDYVIWMGSLKLMEKCSEINLKRAYQLEVEGQVLQPNETLPVVSREAVRIEQRLKREKKGFLLPACLEVNHVAAFPSFIRDIASEPLMEWPSYQGIFRLLSVMLPSWRAVIEAKAQAFAAEVEKLNRTPESQLLSLLEQARTIQAMEQQYFEQALQANSAAQLRKLTERSDQLKKLGQDWHLKPSELDLLQQAQLALRSHYQQQAFIQLLDDSAPLPLTELYVNLVIVKEEEQRDKEKNEKEKKENNPADFRKTLLGNYEDIHRPKQSIELKDLFKLQKTQRSNDREVIPQKLLLLGRAGIGKTTLCLYFADQWLQQKLFTDLPWIFHIELKKLVRLFPIDKPTDLSKVLYYSFFKNTAINKTDSQQIWQLLALHPENIFWVLDGYDEVVHLNHPVVEQLLQQPRYLLTSRPSAIAQAERHQVDVVLENIGFTRENVQQYIQKAFSQRYQQPEQGKALSTWLKTHTSLAGLCAIPIYLELLCQVWATHSETLAQQGEVGFADLYQLIVDQLMTRFLQRLNKDSRKPVLSHQELREKPEVVLVQRFLGELALEGLQTGRLLINGSTFTACYDRVRAAIKPMEESWSLRELIQGVGLLKEVGEHSNFTQNDYYFIHLTFQEFFAARYLALGLQSDDPEKRKAAEYFIINNRYNPRYQQMFCFIAGLLRTNDAEIIRYLDLLRSPPGMDLTQEHFLGLLAHCVAEVYDVRQTHRLQRLKPYIMEMSQHLQRWWVAINSSTSILGQSSRSTNFSPTNLPFFTALRLSPQLGEDETLVQCLIRQEFKSGEKNALFKLCEIASWGQFNHPVIRDHLIQVFGEGSDYNPVRQFVTDWLINYGQTHPISPLLIDILQDKQKYYEAKIAAAEVLGRLGVNTSEVVQALLQALADLKNSSRATVVIRVLGQLRANEPEVVQTLIEILSSKESYATVKGEIAKVLLEFEIKTPEFIQAITNIIKEDINIDENTIVMVVKLLQLGIKAPEVIQLLLQNSSFQRLMDTGSFWREEFWRKKIVKINQEDPQLVSVLIQALSDRGNETNEQTKKIKVRKAAIQLLEQIGAGSLEAIQALIEHLGESFWEVSVAAIDALVKIGQKNSQVISALVQVLGDKGKDLGSKEQKVAAVEILKQLGAETPEVIQALILAAKDSTNDASIYYGEKYIEYKEIAAQTLGQLGVKAPDATRMLIQATLIQVLEEDSRQTSQAAIDALVKIGQKNSQVISILAQVLDDRRKDKRAQHQKAAAIEILRQLGIETPEVIQALILAAKDSTNNASLYYKDKEKYMGYKEIAIQALGQLGVKAPDATQMLIQATLIQVLEEDSRQTLQAAIDAIAKLGQKNPQVISALAQILGDKGKDKGAQRQKAAAVKILGQLRAEAPKVMQVLQSPEFTRALIQMLENKDVYIVKLAAETVEQVGIQSLEIIQLLLQILQDKDPEVRQVIVRALGHSHANTLQVVPALIQVLLRDNYCVALENYPVREAALTALENLGSNKPEVIQALKQAIANPDNLVDVATAEWLLKFGPEDLSDIALSRLSETDVAKIARSLNESIETMNSEIERLWVTTDKKIMQILIEYDETQRIYKNKLSRLSQARVNQNALKAIETLPADVQSKTILKTSRLIQELSQCWEHKTFTTIVQLLAETSLNEIIVDWLNQPIKALPIKQGILALLLQAIYQQTVLSINRSTDKKSYQLIGYPTQQQFCYSINDDQAAALYYFVPKALAMLYGEKPFDLKVFEETPDNSLLLHESQNQQDFLLSESQPSAPASLIVNQNIFKEVAPTSQEKWQAFNAESQSLLVHLQMKGSSFILESEEKQLAIRLDAEVVEKAAALDCLRHVADLIKKHFLSYLSGDWNPAAAMQSDGVFHTLAVATKSEAYAQKLEKLLREAELFKPFYISPQAKKQSHAIL